MDDHGEEMTGLNWTKRGLIFKADGQREWMHSHVADPRAFVMGDFVRIYFASRDKNHHPHVGFIDINPEDPGKILQIAPQPCLGPGPWGYFDDNGVYPGCVIKVENKIFMYYTGRSNGTPPVFYMSIGLAESHDGGVTFERHSTVPVLDRSPLDPWATATPYILAEDGGFKMWYTSGLGWENVGADRPNSLYFIRCAESQDGLLWSREETVSIPLLADETNVASPAVWKEDGRYFMIFSSVKRNERHYSLGFAQSNDGILWTRDDAKVGIRRSEEGWDSLGMAYPNVFQFHHKQYLLYSGNEFGKTGMGLAIRE